MKTLGWSKLLPHDRPFPGEGRFPIRAYSEFLPSPFQGIKPYGELDPISRSPGDELHWNVTEYEERWELRPGLETVASHLLLELRKLARGEKNHQLSKTLLEENPAWTARLAAHAGSLPEETYSLLLPLALSRTQDDKGLIRWTLFGSSHEGPARAFWRSFDDVPVREHASLLARVVGWATRSPEPTDLKAAGVRVLPLLQDLDFPLWSDEKLPEVARALVWSDKEPVEKVRTLVTFRPFEQLPGAIQDAYLSGNMKLVPYPGSLVFFWHASYRKLAKELDHAMQVPLLHLFPRSSSHLALRIPQSGWLDEHPDEQRHVAHGHKVVKSVKRTHRWQRIERDSDEVVELDDKITIALFSTAADDLGLYNKPMARNAQLWSEQYDLVLDGPHAGRREIAAAERVLKQGGHFGYRFFYPPMRVVDRRVYWHRPLVARLEGEPRGEKESVAVLHEGAPLGFFGAEKPGEPPVVLFPRLLDRPWHRDAASLFPVDPGQRRRTTAGNLRKLIFWEERLGKALSPTFARRLVHMAKETSLEQWLASASLRASDIDRAAKLVEHLRARIGPEVDLLHDDAGCPRSHTLGVTHTRAFEESYWRTIASLAEGAYREKDNADAIEVNKGRTGGKKAAAVGRVVAPGTRDLEALGEHLHRSYAELFEKHGMRGQAFSADHVFRWETDFDFEWSRGWARNQSGEPGERNIVCVIPGRHRGEAVIMGDHYDTAYMEDVYEPLRGGDKLRAAAAGADDNHSATAALLHAADALLPLSKAGLLERDVWLVHLTGEEFPADCLGARALAQRLVEGTLVLTGRDGKPVDVSGVRVRGAFVLDMVAHNNDRDRDVFQIAPGEGPSSARLAWHAHVANERWNRSVPIWNEAPERKGRGRAQRMADGSKVPPIAEHLVVAGEVRPHADPRSALYNTDGQIFSDAGIPVVLFMENYDIRRDGYHDTKDTMAMIDLDYGAAVVAIAIETVASVAMARDV
jgi:hypothetical protein